MTSTDILHHDTPANWSAIALDLMRLVRVLKSEYAAAAELLQITLDLLRTADQDRDRARAAMIVARDEARTLRAELAALRGRPGANERVGFSRPPKRHATTCYHEVVQ